MYSVKKYAKEILDVTFYGVSMNMVIPCKNCRNTLIVALMLQHKRKIQTSIWMMKRWCYKESNPISAWICHQVQKYLRWCCSDISPFLSFRTREYIKSIDRPKWLLAIWNSRLKNLVRFMSILMAILVSTYNLETRARNIITTQKIIKGEKMRDQKKYLKLVKTRMEWLELQRICIGYQPGFSTSLVKKNLSKPPERNKRNVTWNSLRSILSALMFWYGSY